MRALVDWPLAQRRQITGVFTDIDDTLTTQGTITPDALAALDSLRAAGLVVIAITGRPAGWCEGFMNGSAGAPWPVDAMVAENGALAFVPPPAHSTHEKKNGLQSIWNKRLVLSKIYQLDAKTRATNFKLMSDIAARLLQEMPNLERTRGCAGRETDIAFDHHEFANLPPETVAKVVAQLQAAGLCTSVSSIHIHGCVGLHTKWTGAQWIIRALFGRDLQTELNHWVFVGDSGNDEAMFEHFTHSVGVANISHSAPQMAFLPRYVSALPRGAGFAQVAATLLAARGA